MFETIHNTYTRGYIPVKFITKEQYKALKSDWNLSRINDNGHSFLGKYDSDGRGKCEVYFVISSSVFIISSPKSSTFLHLEIILF